MQDEVALQIAGGNLINPAFWLNRILGVHLCDKTDYNLDSKKALNNVCKSPEPHDFSFTLALADRNEHIGAGIIVLIVSGKFIFKAPYSL